MHSTFHRRLFSLLHQHRQMCPAKNRTGQDLRGSGAVLHLRFYVLHPISHTHKDQRHADSQ